MLATTQAFREGITAPQRTIKPLLELDFRPNEAVFVTEATASSFFSESTKPANATQMLMRPQDWSGGGNVPFRINESMGWFGAQMSDENGSLDEHLTVVYSKAHTISSLILVSYEGYFPVNFSLDARIGGQWETVYTQEDNELALLGIRLRQTITADAIRINITKIPTEENNVRILTFGIPSRLLLQADDIEDFKTLEETSGDDGALLGSVTSNELSLGLRNDHRWFTPANTASPLQEFLRPGVVMKPYIGLETSVNYYELVPLGTYYATDWDVPAESLTASLTGLDRLYLLNSQTPRKVPVVANTTIRALFELLFRSYGLRTTEYEIDRSLVQKIKYGWIPKGSFSDAAQKLADAGNCSVVVSRTGKFLVKNNYIQEDPVVELHDDNSIMSIQNPVSFLKTYNAVKVKYRLPTIVTDEKLLTVEQITFPPGRTSLKDLEFQTGPAVEISKILLSTPPGVLQVREVANGAWYADIVIENTSWETVTGDLTVYGSFVELTTTEFTSQDHGIAANELRTHEIDNDLIQDLEVAKIYALGLRIVLEDPSSTFEMTTRGDPTLELMDVLTVGSLIDGIPTEDITANRYELTYDGGIEMFIQGKRPKIPTQKVFFNSTFWIELPMPITEGYYR